MAHDYYDSANLQRLKVATPLLYIQLEKMLPQIHACWESLTSSPATPNKEAVLMFLDLVDLVDGFSEICRKIRTEFHTRTSQQFFRRIDGFNHRSTQLQIALALYNDLFVR